MLSARSSSIGEVSQSRSLRTSEVARLLSASPSHSVDDARQICPPVSSSGAPAVRTCALACT